MKELLILDDDIELLEALKDVFESTSRYKVTTASSAAEANRFTADKKYDLVITDYRMPVATGIDFYLAMKEQLVNSDTPIIFYSGYVDEFIQFIQVTPQVKILEKPTDGETLLKTADELSGAYQT